MNKQNLPLTNYKFFTQLTQTQIGQIKNTKIFSANSFIMQQDISLKIILTLSQRFLIIQKQNSNIILGTQFNFQLKFKTIKNDRDVRMNGLQFISQRTGQTQNFYCQNYRIIQTFTKYLLKKINHLGFHHLFTAQKKLGTGNFASVFSVTRKADRKVFAAKAFSKAHLNIIDKGKQGLIHQTNILKKIMHKNLIQFQGVYESQNSLYIIFQLMKGGTLFNALEYQLPSQKIKNIIRALLQGLKYLHENNIVHRDIKLQNIMFRDQRRQIPVLIDFGLSTYYNEDKHIYLRCGTPGFIAPQIFRMTDPENVRFYPQSDIFAVGVIFYTLLTRKPLFEGTTTSQIYEKNKKCQFDLQNLKQEVRNQQYQLLSNMLKINYSDRISSTQALKSQYFQQKVVVSPAQTKICIDQQMEQLELK